MFAFGWEGFAADGVAGSVISGFICEVNQNPTSLDSIRAGLLAHFLNMFYFIVHGGVDQDQWAWALSLRPDMDEVSEPCDVCGLGRLYPGRYPERALCALTEGGVAYPDMLGCGSYPLTIVSQALVEDWEAAGITGFKKFECLIPEEGRSPEIAAEPPLYFHLKVTGSCELDLDAMGLQTESDCARCGRVQFRRGSTRNPKMIIVPDTWDGTDLFISRHFPAITFCSDRVFDLARRIPRTNMRFVIPSRMDEFPWPVAPL